MEGDILYVVRKPIGFRSFSSRKTSRSTFIDQIIARTMTYKHYGVEVENGYVIHFICDSIMHLKDGSIQKCTLDEFTKDGVMHVDTHLNGIFSTEKIVKRAYSRLHTNFDGYNLMNNNCEHFATWCATGTKDSKQYRFAKKGSHIITYPKRAVVKVYGYFIALM